MATLVGGWRGLPLEIRMGLVSLLVIVVGGVAVLAIWQGLQAVGNVGKQAASGGAQKFGQKYTEVKEDVTEASAKKYLEKELGDPGYTVTHVYTVEYEDVYEAYSGYTPAQIGLADLLNKNKYSAVYYFKGYRQREGGDEEFGFYAVYKEKKLGSKWTLLR